MGTEASERSSGKPIPNSQSEQNGNNQGGQTMGSNHVGNGLAGTGWSNLGNAARERSLLEHNRKMMKKMKEENIPWAESYPGELYPTEQ